MGGKARGFIYYFMMADVYWFFLCDVMRVSE